MNRPYFKLLAIVLGVFIIHLCVLFFRVPHSDALLMSQKRTQDHDIVPLKLRTLGVEQSQKDNVFVSGVQKTSKTPQEVQKNKGNPFEAMDLSDLKIQPKTAETPTKTAKAIDNLQLSGSEIKEYLKTPTGIAQKRDYAPTPRVQRQFGQLNETPGSDSSLNNSNVAVNIEVPKGVNLDELNEEELVFYSFQKRSALQYIATFYNKLQEFERKNPHVAFPITKEKTRMTGRITYDKDGNIVRIKMLEWTETQRLQDFFVNVLEELQSLPNPPKLLIDENDEFSVVYSLIINV